MNLEKVCDALSQTDELGHGLLNGCAITQLLCVVGKSQKEIEEERHSCLPYCEYFDGLLFEEYEMDEDDEDEMWMYNDACSNNDKERQKLVLAKYEEKLIESLISESLEVPCESLQS